MWKNHIFQYVIGFLLNNGTSHKVNLLRFGFSDESPTRSYTYFNITNFGSKVWTLRKSYLAKNSSVTFFFLLFMNGKWFSHRSFSINSNIDHYYKITYFYFNIVNQFKIKNFFNFWIKKCFFLRVTFFKFHLRTVRDTK